MSKNKIMIDLDLILAVVVGVFICSIALVIWVLVDMKINPGTYVCSMDEELEEINK